MSSTQRLKIYSIHCTIIELICTNSVLILFLLSNGADALIVMMVTAMINNHTYFSRMSEKKKPILSSFSSHLWFKE